jgi:transposase-like protein
VKSHPHQTCQQGTGVRRHESVYPCHRHRALTRQPGRSHRNPSARRSGNAGQGDRGRGRQRDRCPGSHPRRRRPPTGRSQGSHPERDILTGLGPIEVKQPRVLDRRSPQQQQQFTPNVLPPYLRRTTSVDEAIPWLSLKGISTGDFSEALQGLFGIEAQGLSANTVTRLKAAWEEEHAAWSKRSFKGKPYVSVGADGVHFNLRLDDDRPCILVLMGATADGQKERIAIADGYREASSRGRSYSWT